MAYVPNATDASQPTGDKSVASAAPEFRTLKTFTNSIDVAQDAFQAQLDALQIAIGAGNNSVALAANLASSSGSSLVGFLQISAGATLRTVQSKLRDNYFSVFDFGAIGNGIVNDAAAIQLCFTAALALGKGVYLPTPPNFYNILTPINVGYSPQILGEHPISCCIRNTAGAGGAVFNFAAVNEHASIRNLKIGGVGGIGLQVNGGVFNVYLSSLVMEAVNFENDLLISVNANLIFADWCDCSSGYYQQFGANANHRAIYSPLGGGFNPNMNRFTRCKFIRGGPTQDMVTLLSGLEAEFNLCDWSQCGRLLRLDNCTGVSLNHCYSEQCNHAVSLIDINQNRTELRVVGGSYFGDQLTTAGSSIFRADNGSKIIIQGADLVSSATSFAYTNASTGLHSPPSSGIHRFSNVRIQGNAADPLLWLDNIVEDGVNNFTSIPTSLTVVNGTGGATYPGVWSIRNRIVTVTINVVTTGTCTTASTIDVTYFTLPANVPLPAVAVAGSVVGDAPVLSIGSGKLTTAGRFYTPAWAARNGPVTMSFSYAI